MRSCSIQVWVFHRVKFITLGSMQLTFQIALLGIRQFVRRYPRFRDINPGLNALFLGSDEMVVLPFLLQGRTLSRLPDGDLFRELNQECVNCQQYASMFEFFVEYASLYPEFSGADSSTRHRLLEYRAELSRLKQRICKLRSQASDYRRTFDVLYLVFEPYSPELEAPASKPDIGILEQFLQRAALPSLQKAAS